MHLLFVLPLLMLSFGECAAVNETQSRSSGLFPSSISVTNGQVWGKWGKIVRCPSGTYATGFNLKVDPSHGIFIDDTALNAIALYCTKRNGNGGAGGYTIIMSTEGSWGPWGQAFWCATGVLTSFQLRVDGPQGWLDDTAANNIRFRCSSGQEIVGDGLDWGSWGSWSSTCRTGICGIQTRVQPPQGILTDDTSLNDVVFTCC